MKKTIKDKARDINMGYSADDMIKAANAIGKLNKKLNNKYGYGEVGEAVEHPKHYNQGNIEVIDAIEDWELNFNLGNVIKYIARCEYKENKVKDLCKAKWYIDREIAKVDKNG